jgi:catechol 2,3-dioxygenase-like lactoylglutathione lyase family enzyme
MLGSSNACPTIGVKDLAVARPFYENVLGLSVSKEMPEGGIVLYTSGNGLVQIYKTDFAGTNKATTVTWEVTGIEDIVKALAGKGVVFEHYDMPGTELVGDVHSMGGDKAAWFKDPDGNILCVHQSVA